MRSFYRIILYLGLLICFLSAAHDSIAQCPTGAVVSPDNVTICSGDRISVTIASASTSNFFQLQNDVTNEPLSGLFQGTGGALVIESNALTSNVTIKVFIANVSPFCTAYLTEKVVVTVNQQPTVASAGADQTNLCGVTSTTLAANTPGVGTGAWSIVSGAGGTVNNPSSPTSTFDGIAGTTYVLKWSISNGVCPASEDEVTIQFDEEPSAAVAGADIEQCNNSVFTLNAVNPAIGTGKWTVETGTATITNPNSFNTTVTGVPAGSSATLRWTVSNGSCADKTDEIILTNRNAPVPTLASDDADNIICSGDAVEFTAGGGTNYDFRVNGISKQNGASTTYTANDLLNGQVVSVVVTDAFGCSAASAGITMTVNSPPVVSLVSNDADNQICAGSIITFTATPLGGSVYTFKVNGGIQQTGASNVFTTSSLSNGDVVTAEITSAAGCVGTSAGITVTVDAPADVASAGPDQEHCNDGTFTLAGNNPVTGTGTWSIVGPANGATIDSPGSPTSQVSGLTAGQSVTLRWTITNGSCSSFDEVVLTNFATPTVADAGSNQEFCNTSTFVMAANSPGVGTGTWSIQGAANGAVITNVNSPTTTVTGLNAGATVTLRWTIANGVCSSFDEVTLTNSALPTTATAGPDQEKCNDGTFTLAGNVPVIGTGQWMIIGAANGASIAAPSSATSQVNGLLAGQSVTLRWTISNGSCASFDEVTLTNSAPPTAADAGLNQELCNTSTFVMDANSPVIGTGTWSIQGAANGAVITHASSPTTTVTGLNAGSSVTLRWTTTNGSCSSFDEVTLTNSALTTTATAGPDQEKCNDGTFTLAGNVPVTGTGQWTIVGPANGANIVTPTSATSQVNGLLAGQSVTLRWTITNGSCTSFDDVTLTNSTTPTTADAGPNQELCNTSTFVMAANSPVTGTGTWSIQGAANGAVITNINSPTTTVTGLNAGASVTLRWTITNGSCSSFDEVTLTNSALPTIATAGPDQENCNSGTFNLAGNTPITGTGQWTIIGAANGATIVTPGSATSQVNGLLPGQSVTLRWTITNGSCSSFDEVTLTNSATPTTADAGPNQELCNTSTFVLAANTPVTGNGTWTIQGAANGATITNANSPITTITGLNPGFSVTLRWTITNGSCSSFDEVILTNSALPTVATAGPDQEQCNNGSFTLAGNTPTTGTGQWTIIGAANGASIVTPTSATSQVNGLLTGQSVTLRWTITNGSCTSFDEVTLTNSATPTAADAGPNQELCNTSTFVMAANSPVTGSGAWSIQGAANGAVITNINSPTTTVTGLTAGFSVTLRWTITNGSCSSFDEVTLTNSALTTTATAGPDQEKCNDGSFTLAGNTPVTGTGQWTIVGAANGANIVSPTLATSQVNGLLPGQSVTLRWTITNGSCSSFDEVTLTNSATPTAADAGPNQELCNTPTFVMAANTPVTGNGVWSIQGPANGAVITNINSPTTTVTGLAAGSSVTLRWTITNGSCSSFDEVALTNSALPTTATAGPDQEKCNDGTFTLAGNTPVTGTGQWTIVGAANGASIVTPSSATSQVTGLLAAQSVTLRWTITNGSCTSFDEVTLTNSAAPTVADAGPNQEQCNTSTFVMAANSPIVGNGTWSIQGVDNGAVITNINSPTTIVTGLAAGFSVTLRWTITNGSCSSFDEVTLTNSALPTTATAGPDQEKCNDGTFTLAGNTPVTGTGQWTIVGAANGASIVTPSSATSQVNGLLAGQSVTLRWTITNGSCTSFDEVTLTNSAAPTVADAGSNQEQCNLSTFVMAANSPLVGTGAWSIQGAANGAVITNINSPTTTVTGLVAGSSVTLRWTITNGSCSSFDEVTLTNSELPTTASAGPDQEKCNDDTFTLAGNAPVTGTGQWTIIGAANGASIVTPTSATSQVTGLLAGQSVTLRWTITNGSCESFDEITLTNSAAPTVANAGPDQELCNTSTFVLAANSPTTGTGAWSIQGAANGAVITNINSPTTTVTGLTAGSSVTLRWTITNGSCSSFDEVTLTNSALPTVASAGPDQEKCNDGTFTLAGNAPVTGTGQWTIIGAANGASIVTPTSATSQVNGLLAGQSVTLRWTITNGSCESYDEVTLTNSAAPTVADAGADQEQCNTPAFVLAANAPLVGTGAWSIQGADNGAVITNINSPTTTVTGLSAGASVTLRWTITNGSCSTFDEVTLTNSALPTTASAGLDQEKCNDGSFTLAGNTPVTGTGEWTIVGAANGASIVAPTSATSQVNGLLPGQSVTLRWTITNGSCVSFDEVTLTNSETPTIADAGPDQEQCNTSTFVMAANVPVIGAGTWSIQGPANGAVITNANSPTTTVTGLIAGSNVVLRWTITNGSCSSFDEVILTNSALPTTAVAGPDQEQCNDGTFTLAGNVPVTGTGEWTIIGSANGASIVTPTSASSQVSGLLAGQSVTLRWTITNRSCESFDEVVLTNSAEPTVADAGPDQEQCNTSTFVLAANSPVIGAGAWSIQGPANGAVITNVNSPTTTITGLTAGTSVVLRWTITNGSCSSFDEITLTNSALPTVATAGPDQEQCNNGSFTLAGNAPATGTGQWSIIGAANGATIDDPSSPTSQLTGLMAGQSVVLRWTITNGSCSNFDEVTLTNSETPTTADAGPDQEQCNTPTFVMAANTPVIGTGVWSIQGAANGAVITNPASPTTTITGLTAGQSVVLRWTITNGSCSSFDEVTLTNSELPTVASAGPDQEQCDNGSFVLAANTPVIGTGTWTIIGAANGAIVDDPTSPTSQVNGLLAGQSVTLRWTITNGSCSSFDEITLTNSEAPTIATAGADQEQCNTSTFVMAANVPVVGNGVWSIQGPANGAVITNVNSPTTTITGLTAGSTVTLRWTITNGSCSNFDEVVLTNSALTTVAAAGPDQEQCDSGTFTLAGNTPVTGTGAWTIIGPANGAVIDAPGSATSQVNGLLPGQSVTLRWTITNGSCSSFDEVTLTNSATPTTADAGSDQVECNTNAFVMAANTPVIGNGLWSIQGPANGAVITNVNSPTTTVTGLAAGSSVTLRWTITNGSCSNFDEVVLTNLESPTVADAGDDQQICGGSTVLDANTPTIGTGEWSIVLGTGGLIDSPTDPVSAFSGTTNTTYVLRWTITNGICVSTDDVQIQLKTIPDVAASNEEICSGESINIPITNPNGVAGTTFSWFVQSSNNVTGASGGAGTAISQVLTSTDGVTQGTVTYRITPEAVGCVGTPIDVVVTVDPTPVVTTPASSLSQQICSGTTLNFTPTSTVAGTTYTWTSSFSGPLTDITASGSGAINDTPVNTGNVPGVITYVITPTVGGCSGNPVSYVVVVTPTPDAFALDQEICSGQSTSVSISNPNNVAGTVFTWIVESSTNVNGAAAGSGNFIGQVLTSADGITPGTVTYRITPWLGACDGPTFDVTVDVTPSPVITNTPSDFSKQICSGEALSFLPTASVGGVTYTWTSTISGPVDASSVSASGSGTITDAPINTGNVDAIVTYRITPHHTGCDGASVDLVVVVKPLPSASASDFTICSGDNAVVTINPLPVNVANTTFSWTALPSANVSGAADGNGSVINQVLTTTDASIGTVIYSVTPFANGCAGPVTDVVVIVNPMATVDAGLDFAVCEPATVLVTGTIGGSASSAAWTIESGAGSISSSTVSGTDVTATYTVHADDVNQTILLRLTTNDPDGAEPCSIVSDVVRVSINQMARVTVPADFTVCEPLSIPLSGNLDPSATSGSWSVITGGGTLSVSSVTGDLVTANYVPAPEDIGGTVSFRLTTNDPDGFGPCAPATDDITITINESAKVDAGSNQTVCEDKLVNLTATIGGATSLVTWSGGSGAAQFSELNQPVSDYTLTPADIANGNITLTITTDDPDGAGPCAEVSDQLTVTINRLPEVLLLGLRPSYAENSDPEELTGVPVSPPGIFTGPGILAGTNQFFPSNAGIGTKIITYTYTDFNGCTNSASQSTIINPVTQIDFFVEEPSDVDELGRLVICENSGNNYLLRLIGIPEWNDESSNPIETKFFSSDPILGPRVARIGANWLINTKDLPGGQYEIQYIFTNTLGATTTLTKMLVVNSAPKALIAVDNSCIDDVIVFEDNSFIPNNTSGGTINRWAWTYGEGGNGNDGFSQNPTYQYASEGFKNLTLSVTTNQGCVHDTIRTIRISKPPTPDFTWSKICVETQTTEFRDMSNPGIGNIIEYAWDFDDGDALGFGSPNDPVPAGTHDGRTSNTYKDPHHKYGDFRVYNVTMSVKTDDGCDNSVTKRVFILDYNKPTPMSGYYENFENGKGTWVETSSHNDLNRQDQYSWVFGTPSGQKINSAFSGVNAWWTGGNPNAETDFSTYYPNDSTEVTGPCLDLTGIERPMISLNYWSHSQENFDGAVVQYSTNGGATWRTIGDAERRGINWYNTKNLPGSVGGENRFAWTGKSGGWKNARFSLDEIPPADRSLVVFRIAFGSNSDNQPDSVLNGFAFDDVYIGEKKRTVLVEQFVNSNNTQSNFARDYIENLYNNQTAGGLKAESDFVRLQYHIALGGFDQLHDDNPTDPNTRASLYNLDTPPVTIMDGILGASPYNGMNNIVTNFNGDHSLVTATEIDRRALDDPAFNIDVSVDMGQSAVEPLSASVTFTYLDSMKSLETPLAFHAALVEGNISGHKNVLRKLIWGSGGWTENRTWVEGESLTLPINYNVDVPITDPDNLYLIVFVQDRLLPRHIFQASITKLPSKNGRTPVGIVDDPFDAEIRNIHIYPNPASRYVNFALENPLTRDYTYSIIDQRGVTVLEGALDHDLRTPQQVEISPLSNGVYFVQFRLDNKVIFYRKVVVMNRE